MHLVAGYCPMGCGRTLYLGEGGAVTCSFVSCPDRAAVTLLLRDRETEHIVEFRARDFTVRHPLRERLGDALMECALHEHVAGLDGPPVRPGRYRAVRVDGRWVWTAVSDAG